MSNLCCLEVSTHFLMRLPLHESLFNVNPLWEFVTLPSDQRSHCCREVSFRAEVGKHLGFMFGQLRCKTHPLHCVESSQYHCLLNLGLARVSRSLREGLRSQHWPDLFERADLQALRFARLYFSRVEREACEVASTRTAQTVRVVSRQMVFISGFSFQQISS